MKVLGKLAMVLGMGLMVIGTAGCPKEEDAQPPVIVAFSANPASIVEWQSTDLPWPTQTAVSLALVDGPGTPSDRARDRHSSADRSSSSSCRSRSELSMPPATPTLTVTGMTALDSSST